MDLLERQELRIIRFLGECSDYLLHVKMDGGHCVNIDAVKAFGLVPDPSPASSAAGDTLNTTDSASLATGSAEIKNYNKWLINKYLLAKIFFQF